MSACSRHIPLWGAKPVGPDPRRGARPVGAESGRRGDRSYSAVPLVGRKAVKSALTQILPRIVRARRRAKGLSEPRPLHDRVCCSSNYSIEQLTFDQDSDKLNNCCRLTGSEMSCPQKRGTQKMPLSSALFIGDSKLEACLIKDNAHVKQGAVGKHVSKIQMALFALDHLSVTPAELRESRYGPSTARAVLSFKRTRNIVNYTYQSAADDIVGKMTIAALDQEMARKERFSYIQPAPSTTLSQIIIT